MPPFDKRPWTWKTHLRMLIPWLFQFHQHPWEKGTGLRRMRMVTLFLLFFNIGGVIFHTNVFQLVIYTAAIFVNLAIVRTQWKTALTYLRSGKYWND